MTAQITDTVIWKQKSYTVLGIESAGRHALFSPLHYGMVPEMMDTGCYRGFFCTYKIKHNTLYLENLTIQTKNRMYPQLNNIQAQVAHEDACGEYTGIGLAISFTGTLRLAADFIEECYRHMGFQETISYRSVIDLTFEGGKLTGQKDLSECLQQMREAQVAVKKYHADNWLPLEWHRKLATCYGYVDIGDIADEFNQYLRNMDPQIPLNIIREISLLKDDLTWFIDNYIDYYERVHNYDHTLAFLKYIGIPSSLLCFLKEQIDTNTSEEQVVLALLKALLEKAARGKWGKNLPIIIERQYLQAQVDPCLTKTIHMKLKGRIRGQPLKVE